MADRRKEFAHTMGREEMFSPENPYFQTAWDSTSLASYMQCPRRYWYEILEGWRPKALSADILFGSAMHESCAVYETHRLNGMEHDPALIAAVRYALKKSKGGILDPVSGEELRNLDEADDPRKTRYTLVRTLVWWADEFGQDDQLPTVVLPDGRPGLELSFRLPIGIESRDGDPILLCGHFDKVADYGDTKLLVERKTTKSSISAHYWRKWNPNVQVYDYDLAAGIVFGDDAAGGVMMEVFQTAITLSRTERHEIRRTRPEREEWLRELRRWIGRAELDATAALEAHDVPDANPIDAYPRNTAACTLHGGCPFQRICSKSPGVREIYLKGEFQRLTWNPLANREASLG